MDLFLIILKMMDLYKLGRIFGHPDGDWSIGHLGLLIWCGWLTIFSSPVESTGIETEMDLPSVIGDEWTDTEEFLNDFSYDNVKLKSNQGNTSNLHYFDQLSSKRQI